MRLMIKLKPAEIAATTTPQNPAMQTACSESKSTGVRTMNPANRTRRTTLFAASVLAMSFQMPAHAQSQPTSKGDQRIVRPLVTPEQTKALRPQPQPPVEVLNDRQVISKGGQSITLAEIRAQQRAFRPPAANAVTKQASLGAKVTGDVMTLPTLIRPGSAGADTGSDITEAEKDPGLAGTVKMYACDTNPPSISKVFGGVTPGSVITLRGACFGTSSGEIRLLGNLPGGFRTLAPVRWDDREIAVQIPTDISGIADGPMSIEATTPLRKVTKAVPVYFTARRETVDVSHLWRSGCQNWSGEDKITTLKRECGNNWMNWHMQTFTGFILSVYDEFTEPGFGGFRIDVNQSCALESAWIEARRGTDFDLYGWYEGPPHSSRVRVHGNAEQHLDVHWYGDTLHSYLEYSLRANASCPVGISPNP